MQVATELSVRAKFIKQKSTCLNTFCNDAKKEAAVMTTPKINSPDEMSALHTRRELRIERCRKQHNFPPSTISSNNSEFKLVVVV